MQTPALRDLIWAVCSPSLLIPRSGWPALFEPGDAGELHRRLACTDTQALDDHLARRRTRFLGSYFEALWEYFFLHDPDFDIIAKNLQIRDGKRTLGELDFVVLDRRTGQHSHLELAIKFYLGFEAPNAFRYTDGKHLWVGPQARDRLDLKLARTLEHQLTLSEHPVARATLAELGVKSVDPRLLFKGYLFAPLEPVPLPDYIRGSTHHAGWVRLSSLSAILDDEHSWHLLQKRHWPAPPYPENLAEPLSADELRDKLHTIMRESQRPYMVVQTDGVLPEPQVSKRYFIVPDDWPQIPTA